MVRGWAALVLSAAPLVHHTEQVGQSGRPMTFQNDGVLRTSPTVNTCVLAYDRHVGFFWAGAWFSARYRDWAAVLAVDKGRPACFAR